MNDNIIFGCDEVCFKGSKTVALGREHFDSRVLRAFGIVKQSITKLINIICKKAKLKINSSTPASLNLQRKYDATIRNESIKPKM